MNDSFYQSIIKESSLGYAYHKIILDDLGIPCDYEFIEVNDAFGKILGLKTQDIVGKRVSQLLPGIEDDATDWIKIYGEVALYDKKIETKQYSSVLNSWYDIKAYSPHKYYFICQFHDISNEMRQSKDLEEFFSINSDLFCIIDLEGNFLNTNSEWENILGYKPEDLKNKNIFDFVYSEDIDATKKAFSSLNKSNTVISFENRYIVKRKNANVKYFEWKIKKNTNIFYAIARDITSNKNENHDLDNLISYSEDFLKTSIENIDYQKITDNIVSIADSKYAIFNLYEENGIDFKTIAISGNKNDIINANMYLKFNILDKSWKGNLNNVINANNKVVNVFNDLLDITEDIIPKPIVSIVKNLFNIGQVVVVKIKNDNITIGDFTIFMKKGKKFNKESLTEIYARQVGLLIDRIKSDEKIKELLNENDIIFNSTQDALFLVQVFSGEQYIYLRNNTAYEKKTKISREDFIGKSPQGVFGQEVGQKLCNSYTKCIKGGIPISFEETIPMPIGVRTWATSLTPIFKDGNPLYIVGSREDITQQKNAQNQIKQSLMHKETILELVNLKINSVDNFLNVAVSQAMSFTKSQSGYIFFYDEDTDTFSLNNWADNNHQNTPCAKEILKYHQNTQIWREVITQRKPVIINNFNDSANEGNISKWHQNINRILSLPVFDKNELIFIVTVVNKEEDYNESDIINLNLLMINVWTVVERKRSEDLLKKEKELFKTTLLSIDDGIATTDQSGNIIILNEIAQKLTEFSQREAYGKPFMQVFDIVYEETFEKCENPIENVLKTKKSSVLPDHALLVSKSGIKRYISSSISPITGEDGEIIGTVLAFRDITLEKQKQDSIKYLSYHDQLTGLYNRRFFEEELIRIDINQNLPITVVMADVNGLKLTNDVFGHHLGDELLKSASQVIKSCCRTEDIVARIGGDEFVILLSKTSGEDAKNIIDRIKEECDKTYIGSIGLSISFGQKTKTLVKTDIQDVLKKAENKMYHHKLFESPSMRNKTVQTISHMLYETHKNEERHSKSVGHICSVFGQALSFNESEINELVTAGSLHDIGKIALDPKLLNQSEHFTDDQLRDFKRHSEIGYRILSSANELSDISQYVLTHHEHWDGSGYPKGLTKDEIPLQARIIALADSYDIMTNDSLYSPAFTKEESIQQIEQNSGSQFDPELAKFFIEEILKKDLI